MERCSWVPEGDELYAAYHDEEWGVPERDDRALYELLTLEGAQAGLSWSTILRKREGYRRTFEGFEPGAVARFDRARVHDRPPRDRERRRPIGALQQESVQPHERIQFRGERLEVTRSNRRPLRQIGDGGLL